MAAENLTAAQLREFLDYDRKTGVFRWKVKPAQRVSIGDTAGCKTPTGYVLIRICGRLYKAHRLAWLHETGGWPSENLDHRNCNPGDNSWLNLREGTPAQNLQNQRKARSSNKSCGLLGATFVRRRAHLPTPWKSSIGLRNKEIYLGYFSTAQGAHEAYLVKKRELHPFGTL